MSDFEMVLMMLFIPIYGIMFYVAGRMNLVQFLLKIAEEKSKEIDNKQDN